MLKRTKNFHVGIIFILPVTIFMIGSFAFLIIETLSTSFTNSSMSGLSSTFIGANNFIYLIRSNSFWNSMRFSLIYAITATSIELLLGFFISYYYFKHFNEPTIINKLSLTLLIIPMMVPSVLFGLMNRILLNNIIGSLPTFLHLLGINIQFFAPNFVFWTLIITDVWQWTPFVVIIIYASLISIPKQIIEASELDGANDIQKIYRIIIPYILPGIITATFLRFIDSFRVFDIIYALTGGGPGNLTTSISVYIYKTGFQMGMQGLASAAGLLLFVIVVIPSWLVSRRVIKS
jgi:multiple sugar transport system permease protein